MREFTKKPFDKSKSRTARPPRRDGGAGKAARLAKFQIPKGTKIDYKNLPFLQRYLTDRGKIVSRRFSGISARDQRALATAVRRARFLGLVQVGVRRK